LPSGAAGGISLARRRRGHGEVLGVALLGCLFGHRLGCLQLLRGRRPVELLAGDVCGGGDGRRRRRGLDDGLRFGFRNRFGFRGRGRSEAKITGRGSSGRFGSSPGGGSEGEEAQASPATRKVAINQEWRSRALSPGRYAACRANITGDF